jgi:hypothetical protein
VVVADGDNGVGEGRVAEGSLISHICGPSPPPPRAIVALCDPAVRRSPVSSPQLYGRLRLPSAHLLLLRLPYFSFTPTNRPLRPPEAGRTATPDLLYGQRWPAPTNNPKP